MKVTIVGGSGGVGASTAFNLLLRAEGHDVVLVDRRPEMVASHVSDLEQILALGAGRSIRGGDRGDLADADVVVLSAAVPLTVNTSRLVYLADNAAIVRDIVDALPPAWPGVLLMVTNPVDPLCTWAHRRTGIDRRRIVGYSLNDGLRLRTGLAARLGVAPAAVEAWTIGEHGDACVPLWDRVRVDGAAVDVGAEDRAAAEAYLRAWYARHVALDSGRSTTWTSGLGIARMVGAVSAGADAPWPATVVLEGEYGVDGVALSVPVRLGPGGVSEILEWELSAAERAGVAQAATAVRAATDAIAIPATGR